MRFRLYTLFAITIAVLILDTPLFAHHGTAAYDTTTQATLKGTVTSFLFINPHVQLSFDVRNDKGVVENWTGEITSPSQLARNGGWTKDSLKEGDHITVSGNRARNGSFTMRILKVVLSNGQELKIGGAEN